MRKSKKLTITISLSILLILILIPTIYKLIKQHRTNTYLVVEKAFVEAAEKCWNEKKCSEKEITLKELYDNKYLDTLLDPITKKKYDENSSIKQTKKGYKINLN